MTNGGKREHAGRPPGFGDPRRIRLIQKFNLTRHQAFCMKASLIDQLDRCKTDMARRLLLGRDKRAGRKQKTAEVAREKSSPART